MAVQPLQGSLSVSRMIHSEYAEAVEWYRHRWKPKNLQKNLSQFPFVDQKKPLERSVSEMR
jgi:hypothetical protein